MTQTAPEPSPRCLPTDYGIKPKQPHFRITAPRKQLAGLQRAGKTKRDELDLEYYYDVQL